MGAAGSGKTYCAVACAVDALFAGEIKKIMITRPAVEAGGENLGFLPGDLQEKVSPYLFPIFDALDEMVGRKKREQLLEDGTIEICPLAYMRGRTLNDAFVILDEAQNTTPELMKMFLTRLGKRSKMIVNGDPTQNDLKHFQDSGLMDAIEKFENVQGIGITKFSKDDVVRHKIVKVVIDKYDV